MKTKKKLKKRIKKLTSLLEAFANAFNVVIDDQIANSKKFDCRASCSGDGAGSFGACSDVGTIGPAVFKDDGGWSRSFIPLPTGPCGTQGATGPCGVIGSTGPIEVRKPSIVGATSAPMNKDYGSVGCTGPTGPEVSDRVLVLPNDRQLLSDLKFKIANHERDFKNAFRTLQNVMSFNDLNNIHIDDLLSKLDSSYKNYVCHSNTFFSISKS